MLRVSINLWMNKDIIFNNIDKYCGYNKYINNIICISKIKDIA
jgi:hypothetical protein